MKIVDLNVLLYAVNEDATQHEVVHHWWVNALNGDETIGLPWIVLLGFLRIATNEKVYPQPLPVDDALERLDRWLATAPAAIVTEKPEHWTVLRELLAKAGVAGNLTTDAHLATLAITHGASLVSCDTDFARFAGLRWENPLTAS